MRGSKDGSRVLAQESERKKLSFTEMRRTKGEYVWGENQELVLDVLRLIDFKCSCSVAEIFATPQADCSPPGSSLYGIY